MHGIVPHENHESDWATIFPCRRGKCYFFDTHFGLGPEAGRHSCRALGRRGIVFLRVIVTVLVDTERSRTSAAPLIPERCWLLMNPPLGIAKSAIILRLWGCFGGSYAPRGFVCYARGGSGAYSYTVVY